MSSASVDTFSTPWQPDASGLWTVASTSAAARYGADGLGLEIHATAGAPGGPAPYAERNYTPALDLRGSEELRLWLRSSRPGDGTPARPVYLGLEATRDPPVGSPWVRLLPVAHESRWQLVTLWIGDMPTALRQAVGFLRLRSLDPAFAFTAYVDDLIETTPRAIADTASTLVSRLDGAYTVDVSGTPTAVPAILDVPENPGTRTRPYILVTPSALTAPTRATGAADEIDTYTATGAHVRPAQVRLELGFRVDVFADTWEQKSAVLDAAVVDLLEPLVVNGAAAGLAPYAPSEQERAATPGRAPLYYRVSVAAEVGPRTYRDLADPFLMVGHPDRVDAEAVQL